MEYGVTNGCLSGHLGDRAEGSSRRPDDLDDAASRRAILVAGRAVERYGLRDARLRLLRRGHKQVFRVVSPTEGEFVLKTYEARPAGHDTPRPGAGFSTGAGLRSPETIQFQLLWLTALRRETGLLVPEPVPTVDGSLVGYVSFLDLSRRRELLRRVWRGQRETYHLGRPGRLCVLLRWVPGRHKRDPRPEDLAAIGCFVAKMHRHADRYPAPGGASLPRWGWDWAFGEAASLWSTGGRFYSAAEMEVFRATARRAGESLRELGEDGAAFGLIHRDLKPDNLVFHDGEVGAIDFDLWGRGHYLLDLAVMLESLKVHHRDNYEPLRTAFLEGYERERSLPAGYPRHLRTFTAMLTTASVNRTLELLGSRATAHQARGPRFPSNAVKRLAALLEKD